MAKKLDEATRLLIDSLPENLQKLAMGAIEVGYLSRMDFTAATEADEVPDTEHDEVLDFFQQDLGLEILETDNYPQDLGRYYDNDDEEPRDKTRNLLNADAEQVDVNDDDYEHYAKQLERSQTGALVLGVQDSVQSYLKQIGTVQLLTAAGEVAIAQRIEAASRLMVYGLCESPMTIQAMLDWYQQLLNEDIRLRYIVNLEVMYSSESEQKSLAALSEALKSKGVEHVDELDDDDLDDLADASVDSDEDEEDEEDEDGIKKEDTPRGTSGVPIPVMEESLMPMITDLFAKIKRIFNSMQKLQAKRLDNLLTSDTPDAALEKKYTKLRLELFEHVSKIRLNDDRIAEILEQLTKRDQLLMGLEGKLLRLALANKIKREDFLVEYTGNELNRNWVKKLAKHKNPAWANFAKKHEADILKIQEDITAIANETGQPTAEYKKVVELVRRGQTEAARAKREMIEANLRLVIKFAKKSSNRGLGLDFSDLVQDGNIGLMKAVDKFDYRLGNKFSTYATNWIQQGISRSIADQARTIRIPVHMIDNIHKIQRASRQFMHKYGRQPTAEELSKIIYLPVDKIHKAMKVNLKPISLEAPVGTEDDSSRIEIIADETAKNPFVSAAQKNLRKIVTQILSELDPKEETVLRQRFGMSTNKTSTLEEVGEYIGVTRERIRQIEQKALNKLKHPTRARKLRSFLED
ncbi:MAG: RNA polymerase sigma factor RpoD [Alphaproteobacteria bacterium]|nr:RNA polymerase sigma factor RpoD [Alphaproteobacteria bacterium]MBQ4130595.1 RNA polymerase sigma factor RpoD [Alphaproteobacteria bacterium]MBQ8368181.1 RNA polymerase sigma factor RpoD [Alphaproteobacteria bacterium]MBR5566635.1 RNA polymerase sigma factor RpoD [Alphaproteobacteria bacterium]